MKKKVPISLHEKHEKKSNATLDVIVHSADVHDSLFDRVATILEQMRTHVVRAVNTNMVQAYWLIGREIVEEVQFGKDRAAYGETSMKDLSEQLTKRYGEGFSVPNLKNIRQFYQVYPERGIQISYPTGSQLPQGFSPHLSWSHYRALMRVSDEAARDFYEQEAVECGWSKAQLERQIHSAYYHRILANQGEDGLVATNRDRLLGEITDPTQMLKSPYVLEFLGLPNSNKLHETDLEATIINNLQAFLLELGKGFSFVARQKHIRFDDEDFYVDLVFYNYILKCFLLIDLKMGKLSLQDVGQMDGYVRLYQDRFSIVGDNPTIGLILCADKSEAVAKYSVLAEGQRIFASQYLQYLPSEAELQHEIERQKTLFLVQQQDNEHSIISV